MSSILTNTSAMVALQTMRSINRNLAQTQTQISTGKSISNARDSAAVWAISRTMESDVKGFKAISDSLSLGSATVGVARQAAETVTDLLTQMKGLVVAAQEDNVDRSKIQNDINALNDQITAVVSAAQFNGLNLVNGGPGANVLASLDRSTAGVTATSIAVAARDLSNGGYNAQNIFGTSTTNLAAAADAAAFTVAGGSSGVVQIDGTDLAAGDTVSISINGQRVSYTLSADDAALTAAGDRAAVVAVGLRAAIQNLGIEGLTVTYAAGATTGDRFTLVNAAGADTLAVTATFRNEGAGALGILDGIDVVSNTAAALGIVEDAMNLAIDAAAAFGSVQMRIDTQAEFVKNLTDSLTTGIGALVDADLEAASARLQALQVQQQLATQSLSIANQQPQNILALFR